MQGKFSTTTRQCPGVASGQAAGGIAGTNVRQREAARLAERIRQGDRRAEDRLVELFGPGVVRAVDRHANGHPEKPDLYQEAFCTVLQKLRRGELREPAKLPAFLSAVVRNLTIEFYRKAGRRKTESDSEALSQVAAGDPSPLAQLLRRERAVLVRQMIHEMKTPRHRELLHRFYIAEEDREAIAADYGLTSLQFNRALYRARQRYKALYARRL